MVETMQEASAEVEEGIAGERGGSRGLRALAVALCVSTLALIALGALVTGFGVGMAVPDWPTTYGENMFTFAWFDAPWSVQLEHGHRLAGSWVGLLTLALALWLWTADSRKFLRVMGLVALVAVIVQGVLGGMRVVKIDPRWALVHGPLAQAFFALTVALLFFVRGTQAGPGTTWSARPDQVVPGPVRLAWMTAGMVYVQIVTGAALRHLGWGLTLHLLFALGVLVHLGLLVRRTMGHETLMPWALAAAGMGAAQLFLGLLSWVTVHAGSLEGPVRDSTLGAVVSSMHVVTGAALLGTLVHLALKAQFEKKGTVPFSAEAA